jgi:hypothetical protein
MKDDGTFLDARTQVGSFETQRVRATRGASLYHEGVYLAHFKTRNTASCSRFGRSKRESRTQQNGCAAVDHTAVAVQLLPNPFLFERETPTNVRLGLFSNLGHYIAAHN